VILWVRHIIGVKNHGYESNRVLRRLHFLRECSHEQERSYGELFRYLESRIFPSLRFRRYRATECEPEALHRLLQPAPYQTQAWRNESNGISATGSIPLKFNRPTLGGQFIPGVIHSGEVTLGASAVVDPLSSIDDALQQVDNLRSHLGAIQNRFESMSANLNNTINNQSAARSRIEDADYAVEVSNMT